MQNAKISFNLNENACVYIEIYPLLGEKITGLLNKVILYGEQAPEIFPDDFGGRTGKYYVRIWLKDACSIRKVLLK